MCRTRHGAPQRRASVLLGQLSENRQPLDARSQQEIASAEAHSGPAEVLNCQLERPSIAQRLTQTEQPTLSVAGGYTPEVVEGCRCSFRVQTATELIRPTALSKQIAGPGPAVYYFYSSDRLQAE